MTAVGGTASGQHDEDGPRFTVRAAAEGDLEAIVRIWHTGWRDGHEGRVPDALVPHRTAAEFERRAPDRLPITLVAQVDDGDVGAVVGFVMVRDDEIDQLYVDASWRGTGVSMLLLRAGEERIARDHDVAWLAVVPGNGRARRFYERCGWRDAGAVSHPAETIEGPVQVPVRRYEKNLRGARAD